MFTHTLIDLPFGEREASVRSSEDARRYRLSFTSGSLFLGSAGIAAGLWLEHGDWAAVRAAFSERNLLQSRTKSSALRLGRELVQRLGMLSTDELAIVAEADSEERGHLMWAATCRRYELLGEFASEVVRERFLVLAMALEPGDFDGFVRGKAAWHTELADLAPSTLRKLQTSTYLMLREAQLLTETGAIVPAVLSSRVARELARRKPSDLTFFPTNGS